MEAHTHTWTSMEGRGRCTTCGERRPKLVLNLRCEWCKELFIWKPRSAEMIERMRVRRTCGVRCKSALQSWEFNRSRKIGESRNKEHSKGK
jgi:hypothetical protein